MGTDVRVLSVKGDPYVPGECIEAAGGLKEMHDRNLALLKIEQHHVWAWITQGKPTRTGANITDIREYKRKRIARLSE